MSNLTFMSVSNPCTLQLNEIKIGIVNTDVVKDLCGSMHPKDMPIAKIDLSLKGMLEQRLFYPLYPPNADLPIEYGQIQSLYINDKPDILITPSDLTHFVKVTPT